MMNLRDELFALADEKYKLFHCRLVPNIESEKIIGVRLPVQRTLAKRIAEEEGEAYLNRARTDYYEEKMIFGLVCGYAEMTVQQRLNRIKQFVPMIDNWAVCDCVCSTFKFTVKNAGAVFEFLKDYFYSDKEYFVRFAVVMLMDYFMTDEYIDEVLKIFDSLRHDGYYVKMAVAWGISVAFVKYHDKTMTYLKNNGLDDFTYNKSLQKICESNRVDAPAKAVIRSMKRT